LNDPFVKQRILKAFFENKTPIASILDVVINSIQRKDFVISKEYTVKGTFGMTMGKWPNIIKDSVFLDSRHFHSVYVDKLAERVLHVVERENQNNSMTEEQYYTTKSVLGLI